MSGTDKAKNKAEEVKGKIKEGVGSATGDESTEAEGRGDQAKANQEGPLSFQGRRACLGCVFEDDGRFGIRINDRPGRYFAWGPPGPVNDRNLCLEAYSPISRHRYR